MKAIIHSKFDTKSKIQIYIYVISFLKLHEYKIFATSEKFMTDSDLKTEVLVSLWNLVRILILFIKLLIKLYSTWKKNDGNNNNNNITINKNILKKLTNIFIKLPLSLHFVLYLFAHNK